MLYKLASGASVSNRLFLPEVELQSQSQVKLKRTVLLSHMQPVAEPTSDL